MSYILDALKKSEQERVAGDIPNLQTNHAGIYTVTGGKRPMWVMLLSLAIGINLLLLVYVMLRPADEMPLATAQEFKSPVNTIPQSTGSITTTMNELPRYQSARDTDLQTKPSRNTGSLPTIAEPQPFNTASYASSPEPALEPVGYTNLTSLYELPDHVRHGIPHMEFTIHVYSDNPAQRLLIINGVDRDEGEKISNTLKLVEITPGGAIFNSQDYFFEIGVLQDWSFQ